MPMALPAIATVTVLQFIQIWMTCWWASCSCRTPVNAPSRWASPLWPRSHDVDPVVDGGIVSVSATAMIVYLVFQRFLVRGLTMGIDR